MPKICAKCGSGNIRDDLNTRTGRVIGQHCFMCGSTNIIKIKKEEGMSEKKKCSMEGCVKKVFMNNLCYRHYTEKNGPYKPKNKIAKHGEGKKKHAKTQTEKKAVSKSLCEVHPGQRQKPTPNPQKKRTQKNINPEEGFITKTDVYMRENMLTQVDFTGHEKLLKNILEESRKQFRTVELQILYCLDSAMAAETAR